MSIYETVGMAWIVFTAALGHVAILVAAYRHFRRSKELAQRGWVEERRDVVEAFKVREAIGR